MPTPISHAAVGFAIGAWGPHDVPPSAGRVCLAAAACAALPDIDWIGLAPHRGITHSLLFAVLGAAVAAFALFPHVDSLRTRSRLLLILGVALLSHGFLDALSSYSYGIAFLAPFSQQRFRFLWTPLGTPTGDLASQLRQEVLIVFLPAVVLAWAGLKFRRPPRGARA